MKGISLPLETVVLLILAAVVLAALLGFFMGAFTPAQTEADLVRKQLSVCQEIAAAKGGCDGNDAKDIAQKKLVDTKICRADRPACTGTDAKKCIESCCKAFCPS